MSLLTLDASVWSQIALIMDGSDLIRLWMTGSRLNSKLKFAIRSAYFRWLSDRPVPLTSLIWTLKLISTNLSSLKIEGNYSSTAYEGSMDWSGFENLQCLSIPLHAGTSDRCTDLLAETFPNLLFLKLCADSPLPSLDMLPPHLIHLEIHHSRPGVQSTSDMSQVVLNLPPLLETLNMPSIEIQLPKNKMLDWKNIPLVAVKLSRVKCYYPLTFDFLPPSVKHLTAKFLHNGKPVPPPPKPLGWKHFFPALETLNLPLASLVENTASLTGDYAPELPPTLTSISVYSTNADVTNGDVLLARMAELGPSLKKFELSSKLLRVHRLQTLQVGSHAQYVPQELYRFITFAHPLSPHLRKLELTPYATQTRELLQCVQSKGSWPPLLESLTLGLSWVGYRPHNRIPFDLSLLPQSLVDFALNVIGPATEQQFLHDLSRLHQLSRLHLCIDDDQDDRDWALLSSTKRLPPTLQSLSVNLGCGISPSCLSDLAIALPGLQALDLGPMSALPSSSEYAKCGSVNLSLLTRLPPHLTTLTATMDCNGQVFNTNFVKSLPKSLTHLAIFETTLLRWENQSAACLQFLPSRLSSLHFPSRVQDTLLLKEIAQHIPTTVINFSPSDATIAELLAVEKRKRHSDYLLRHNMNSNRLTFF